MKKNKEIVIVDSIKKVLKMLYQIFSKQSKMLATGILLSSLSFASIKSEEALLKGSLFDVRDKNAGFSDSPVPNSPDCLLNQAVTGETTTIYRNSVISPAIAVNPNSKKHVVAAWEQDVTSVSGAGLEIGIGYSSNSGKDWHHTVIPVQSCIGGFIQSIDNVWLSYGPDGTVYLVAAPINASQNINTLNQSGIIASVSTDDGKTWSNPQFLAASQDYATEPTLSFPTNQKPSVTACPSCPGTAYAVWKNSPSASSHHGDAFASITFDGGLTWGPQFTLYDPFNDATLQTISNGLYNNQSVNNNIIMALPNGDLLNFMTRTYATPGATDLQFTTDVWPYQFTLFDIAFVRSTDGGANWDTDATQVVTFDGNATFTNGYTYSGITITGGVGAQTSTEGSNQFFNVNMNPANGNLYVVWQSGQFTSNQLPQIALSNSRDNGFTWTAPVMASKTPVNSPNPQAFTPAVAITKEGNLGLLYYDFRNDLNVDQANTSTDVWFAEYNETVSPTGGNTGVGLDFITEVHVNKHSFIMQNGPVIQCCGNDPQYITSGDYNSVTTHGRDDFYAIYVKAQTPPFFPVTTLIDDVESGTVLLLDNNKRTSPYFSKIDAQQ